jgi:hypothetical protein
VFAIEIEACRRCGRRLRVIASIEAPPAIARILKRLRCDTESVDPAHPCRAPPPRDLSLRRSLRSARPSRRDGLV